MTYLDNYNTEDHNNHDLIQKLIMPVNQSLATPIPDTLMSVLTNFAFLYKIGFGALFVLYFIFALLVVRQVSLMTDTLYTEASPLLHALAIIHAGLSLGVLVLFIGLF